MIKVKTILCNKERYEKYNDHIFPPPPTVKQRQIYATIKNLFYSTSKTVLYSEFLILQNKSLRQLNFFTWILLVC